MLPNGSQSFPSKVGLCLTVVLFFIIILYASLEFLSLYTFGNSNISTHTVVNNFDNSYEFNLDKRKRGFEIAFAFTGVDGDLEMLDEPDYGEVKAFIKYWDAETSTTYRELYSRPCNEQELGLGPLGFDDPHSRFYPMAPSYYYSYKFN